MLRFCTVLSNGTKISEKFLKIKKIYIITLDFYCSQNNRNKRNIFEKIPSPFDGEFIPVP